jgi:hypothetical protein
MKRTILTLCEGKYLSIAQLADLLGRQPEGLRARYIAVLVEQKHLIRLHPGKPNHENQAYRASSAGLKLVHDKQADD